MRLADDTLSSSRIPSHNVNNPPCCHTPCNLAGVCSHALAIQDTACTPPRYHTCHRPNLLAFVRKQWSVITPPRCRTPSITPPPAAGFPCMALIARGTLDSTHPYKSTPSDHIFKGQKVITGVCFHSCPVPSRRVYSVFGVHLSATCGMLYACFEIVDITT